MTITIRSAASETTHRILGSAPGWAHCGAWIDGGETIPDDAPIDCRGCAAQAARENA